MKIVRRYKDKIYEYKYDYSKYRPRKTTKDKLYYSRIHRTICLIFPNDWKPKNVNFYNRRLITGQSYAHKKVYKAVKNGLLTNLGKSFIICVDCKINRATHYEHRDYNKPLEVDPVCQSCNFKRGIAIPRIQKLKITHCNNCSKEATRIVKGFCINCYNNKLYHNRTKIDQSQC